MKIVNLLLFLIISYNSFSQDFVLKGVVTDSETNESLGEVHIQLIDQHKGNHYYAISKLNGEFVIEGIEKGTYQILSSRIGYNRYEHLFEINANKHLDIKLEEGLVNLGEVVVTSMKQEQKIKDVPVPVEIVNREQIEINSSFTASDVLAAEPGITLARDGVWATGVNIRGLSQQRIVMLVDGNRIETATGLMASMSFFDMDDVERIEVIKGASSSLYGTGAMGGIVNVITSHPEFSSSTYFKGRFNGGYSSVNNLFTRKLAFNSGSKKWYASVSGATRDAQNINTPEGEILNSQFADKSMSVTSGYKVKNNHTLELKYQYFDADDVGIPGGDAFPGSATATYRDAKRQMISTNYKITSISDRFNRLNFRYFHQYIIRDVNLNPNVVNYNADSTVRTTPKLFTPSGAHTTDGIQIQSDWSFGTSNNLIVGLDAWRRKVATSREKYIRVDVLNTFGDTIATNNIIRGETPIPDACFGSAGLYVQNEQQFLDDDLKLLVGGRIDGIRITNEQVLDYDYLIVNGTRNDSPPNQRITFEENEEYKLSWSANVGILYSLTEDVDLSLNTGRSFRAPSLEESFKYIDLGNMVRLGDPNLDPEKGYSVDLGLRIWKPKFQFKIDGFVNWLSDMIVEQPGEFVYSYTTGLVDTVPALINSNVAKARLYGVDLSFQYNFYKNVVLHGTGSYVRGENVQNHTDLPLIPPMNGRLGIRYNLPKYGGFNMVAIGFADQRRVAEGEFETKGFARFDLNIYSSLMDVGFAKVKFLGGIENIGNRAYSNHLATNRGSITVEPGRNFYIKMKVLF